VKKRALFGLAVLACLFALTACKANPHDNYRPPDPFPENPVKNHRFDGGETNPYNDPGDHGNRGGDGEGGERTTAPKGE
jgi:hypothetical protein